MIEAAVVARERGTNQDAGRKRDPQSQGGSAAEQRDELALSYAEHGTLPFQRQSTARSARRRAAAPVNAHASQPKQLVRTRSVRGSISNSLARVRSKSSSHCSCAAKASFSLASGHAYLRFPRFCRW